MACCGPRGKQVELISLFFSPWSLKVKWALTHSEIEFVNTEKPLLEWPLRWRLGISSRESAGDGGADGKLTFPILVQREGTLLRQSLDIVKWSHGQAVAGKGLGGRTPGAWDHGIDAWDAKGVQLMRYGRQVALAAAGEDDDKCIEMVKQLGVPIPGDSLKLMAGRAANADFRAKYSEESSTATLEEATSILETLQAHLQKQSSSYIMDGAFSYADVCMVLGLHCIRPFKDDLPLGMLSPVMGVGTEDLASKYEALFSWGQDIINKHLPSDVRVRHQQE